MGKIESLCNQFKKDTGKIPNVFYLGRKELEMFNAGWLSYIEDLDTGHGFKINIIPVDDESYVGLGFMDYTIKEPQAMDYIEYSATHEITLCLKSEKCEEFMNAWHNGKCVSLPWVTGPLNVANAVMEQSWSDRAPAVTFTLKTCATQGDIEEIMDMETKDLKARKEKLEMDIGLSVKHLMNHFEAETGILPKSVDIEMVNSRCVGDKPNEYIISHVKVELEI